MIKNPLSTICHVRLIRDPMTDIAPVVVSRRLLKRIFGGGGAEVFSWSDARAMIYKNEFAIIEVAGTGSAIVDLKRTLLVCAAFELTCEQALAKMAQPGGVEELRAYIAQHPKLLPVE
jgi:hypothetical protein